MEKAQAPMTPHQALDLISQNIARLSGSRQDHAILMNAEFIVRQALGNAPAVQAVPAETEGAKLESVPSGNA